MTGEGGQEREKGVGGEQAPSEPGVHGVVGLEEEQGVQSVQNLWIYHN